ncbi:MAG: hypothetical protein L0Y54_09565 [Sporichthyaceae bacterium]|nr:hypothetical protein [Sporichthyaceae bacterium]
MSQFSRPRTTRARVVITAVVAVTAWLGLAALDNALADHTGLPLWLTGPISLVPMLVLHTWAAPRVGYRWFDAAVLLVPFLGVVWSVRVIWRLTLLPVRDWAPLPSQPGQPGPPPATTLPGEVAL